MSKKAITQQKSKDQFWKDEAGSAIPFNRITNAEKLREKSAASLAKQAIAVHGSLYNLKKIVQEVCDEVIAAIRKENKIKTDAKGNVTWYNFDHSIKIEVDVKEGIRFDEALIDGAKQKLTDLINNNINGDQFIKSLVVDAFSTSAGKLDTKRVLGLKRHSSRIANNAIKKEWDAAMSLIDKSITRPNSKTYFRIWIKDEKGVYQNVDLNFSSIQA
jgi:hypothetical protein